MLNFYKLFKSFKYAWHGLKLVFKEEQNFRIQVVVAVICVILMSVLSMRNWERIVLILVIAFVLVLELINSIFERLVDILKPRVHIYVETIKDVMAAAVLIASVAAIIIGFKIFLPYLSVYFQN